MRYLFFTLIFCLNLFASDSYIKDLQDQEKAEVKAWNLNDAGEYKKNITFIKKALEKYPSSEMLNMFLATALYNENNLDEARIYFTKVLSIKPSNEQAADFISIIDNQQEAKDNKYIISGLDWLQNKGIDFITVFLAFLSGEMIAKHYMQCKGYNISSEIRLFIYRKEVKSFGFIKKCFFLLKNIKYSVKCVLLNFIIGLIAILSIFVAILLFEFISKFSFLSFSSLQNFTIDEIINHVLFLFFIVAVFYFLIKFLYSIKILEKRLEDIERILAQNLIDLTQANLFVVLYQSIKQLKKDENFNPNDFDLILKYIYDENIKSIIKRCYDEI